MVELRATQLRRIEDLTKEQLDQRELPDRGKVVPVHHIVRIVVVDPDSDSSVVNQGTASSQNKDQRDPVLVAAEAKLKGKAAASSLVGASALRASPPGSATPKTMFEVLTPTDIVVVGGNKPASVITIVSSDTPESGNPVAGAGPLASSAPTNQPAAQKVRRELVAHDAHHTDTVLRVWTAADTIEYQCDKKFEIVKVQIPGLRNYGAPRNPFEESSGALPYRAQQGPTGVWSWTSGELPLEANNQQYKMSFNIGGQEVDPDVACGSPPPSP